MITGECFEYQKLSILPPPPLQAELFSNKIDEVASSFNFCTFLHQALFYLDLLEINVMVCFQPGEWMRMMYYSRK